MTLDATDRRTRQRLLEAAVSLLAERGMSGELLRDAAAAAGCQLSRAEVYFRRDEDIILALYARLAADLEARVQELPEGHLAERFRAVMLAKLALVAPYRDALAALLATLLDPRYELGALSEQTELIRSRVMGVLFRRRPRGSRPAEDDGGGAGSQPVWRASRADAVVDSGPNTGCPGDSHRHKFSLRPAFNVGAAFLVAKHQGHPGKG